jgi:hypothetical protein
LSVALSVATGGSSWADVTDVLLRVPVFVTRPVKIKDTLKRLCSA